MRIQGINGEDDRRTAIVQELRLLRKGAGLTLGKLRQTPVLLEVLASKESKTNGVSSLPAGRAREIFIQELNDLGDSLEAKATRNAFAVNRERNPENLTTRRSDFATQSGRHADTIESYENHGIDEIASRLLNEDYVTSPNYPPPARTPHDIKKDPAEMTIENLRQSFSIENHANELVKCFGRRVEPFTDVNIEWLLLPVDGARERYGYYFRYTFKTHRKQYRIAIVRSTHDCENLMSSGVVDDVGVLSSGADYDSEVEQVIASSKFIARDLTSGKQELIPFRLLEDGEARELLRSAWPVPAESCRVLEVDLSQHQSPKVIFDYRLLLELSVAEHYCYWYAPCLMYVNSIVVDVSRFPERHRWRFFVQPFLGSLAPGDIGPTEDRYTLTVGGWLMPGHGIAVIWQEASHQ